MQRLHDCREAGGRTTQGAVVEEQISTHTSSLSKRGAVSCDWEQLKSREVICDHILSLGVNRSDSAILTQGFYYQHRTGNRQKSREKALVFGAVECVVEHLVAEHENQRTDDHINRRVIEGHIDLPAAENGQRQQLHGREGGVGGGDGDPGDVFFILFMMRQNGQQRAAQIADAVYDAHQQKISFFKRHHPVENPGNRRRVLLAGDKQQKDADQQADVDPCMSHQEQEQRDRRQRQGQNVAVKHKIDMRMMLHDLQ
jgi:hypothetical protein